MGSGVPEAQLPTPLGKPSSWSPARCDAVTPAQQTRFNPKVANTGQRGFIRVCGKELLQPRQEKFNAVLLFICQMFGKYNKCLFPYFWEVQPAWQGMRLTHENCCKMLGESMSFLQRSARLSETCRAVIKEMLRPDLKELEPDSKQHEECSDWWHCECLTYWLHLILSALHASLQKCVPYGMDQDIALHSLGESWISQSNTVDQLIRSPRAKSSSKGFQKQAELCLNYHNWS